MLPQNHLTAALPPTLQYDVMVTAGANQAFVNLVCALVDGPDPVVLYAPYYFNHMMALQMTGGADNVRSVWGFLVFHFPPWVQGRWSNGTRVWCLL